jgi:hypothetical protein
VLEKGRKCVLSQSWNPSQPQGLSRALVEWHMDRRLDAIDRD